MSDIEKWEKELKEQEKQVLSFDAHTEKYAIDLMSHKEQKELNKGVLDRTIFDTKTRKDAKERYLFHKEQEKQASSRKRESVRLADKAKYKASSLEKQIAKQKEKEQKKVAEEVKKREAKALEEKKRKELMESSRINGVPPEKGQPKKDNEKRAKQEMEAIKAEAEREARNKAYEKAAEEDYKKRMKRKEKELEQERERELER